MISIISDIHLTDGTSGETMNYKAFNIYKNNLQNLLEKSDDEDTELTIVLLGDILDLIRSEVWLENKIRPWEDFSEQNYFDTIDKITNNIIENNSDTCNVFCDLKNNMYVRGNKIKVNIYYMVGNHDWMFYIKDNEYNSIRKKVCEAFHLSNDFTKPFPFNTEEDNFLNTTMINHKVFARHGDIYDQYNFDKERNKSSLGDAVVVDIITKFAFDLKQKALIKDKELYNEFVNGIRELDNVKPAFHMKIWLDNLIDQTFIDKKLKKQVKQEWKKIIKDFFNLKYVKKQNNIFNWFDQVSMLKVAFKYSKMVGYASKWFSIDLPNWVNASQEYARKNHWANFIVYGHTHSYKVEPLSNYKSSKGIKSQFYINTGTWRPIHKLNKADIIKNSFSSFKMMTFAVFYLPKESQNRFEVWTGYLG